CGPRSPSGPSSPTRCRQRAASPAASASSSATCRRFRTDSRSARRIARERHAPTAERRRCRSRRSSARRSDAARLRLLLDDDDLLTVHLEGAPVGRRLALRLRGTILAPLPQLLLQVLEHLSLRPPGALPVG